MSERAVTGGEPKKDKAPPKADEGLLLHRHGTPIGTLSPGAILQAAKADIAAKRHNAARKGAISPPAKRAYSFFPKHVAASDTPATLIRTALDKRTDAAGSSTLSVRRIYDAPDNLAAALTLADSE
jgi:hypothetical protein